MAKQLLVTVGRGAFGSDAPRHTPTVLPDGPPTPSGPPATRRELPVGAPELLDHLEDPERVRDSR
ncbi:hypothetical protein ACQPZF_14980 [Actinosynnema sp. CS-041913]|uniref:hypothetical protein n=1 Tax=Actinosynnema sp. CS-041913 TaxID=3239917 RepID=UPI003D8C1CAD